MTYVKLDDIAADGLTKLLPRQKYNKFIRLLGIEEIKTLVDL